METFTIHDMLINSTDLNKILCNFGIKNISECESEQDPSPEPKGTVDLSLSRHHQTPCNILTIYLEIYCKSFVQKCHRLSAVFAEGATALGIFLRQCALRIWLRSSIKLM